MSHILLRPLPPCPFVLPAASPAVRS